MDSDGLLVFSFIVFFLNNILLPADIVREGRLEKIDEFQKSKKKIIRIFFVASYEIYTLCVYCPLIIGDFLSRIINMEPLEPKFCFRLIVDDHYL